MKSIEWLGLNSNNRTILISTFTNTIADYSFVLTFQKVFVHIHNTSD